MRPSACTSATSSRTCGRSRRCGRGSWIAQGRLGEALRLGARARPVRRRRPQLPARVRAHHAGPGAPRAAAGRPEPGTPGTRRPGSWIVSCRRRRKAAARDGVIEILVLQALAHQAATATCPAALAALERALTLAEPEGYVRVFVDEGAPMAALLEAAAERGGRHRRLRPRLLAGRDARPGRPAPAGQALVEPLSERELDVLRLLANRPGRAGHRPRARCVSLNTVRTHTKNIYAKLGVNNRRAAVRRAEELDLARTRPLTRRPALAAEPVRRRARPGRSLRSPRQTTTCGDAGSPHRLLAVDDASDVATRRDAELQEHMSEHRPATMTAGRYEIRLKGHLDARWAAWFDGLSLTADERRHHRHRGPRRRPGRAARPARRRYATSACR